MANEIEKRNEAFLIYQDENGIARVNVRFEGEDVWLTVEQIMELFDASQQDVSYHIKQIYADGEQDAERTHKKFLLVRQEGNRSVRRNMSHYNLDMIIAVGLSNSKKLFIDTSSQTFREVKSEGDKLVLQCKDFGKCSGFCRCYSQPGFCKEVAEDYEDEIRKTIKRAFE